MPRPWTLEAWIDHCKEQRDDDRRAVRLAHIEIMRRLHDLNGEAARISARDTLYVSTEKYETAHAALAYQLTAFIDRYQEAHTDLADRITDVASQQKGAAATWSRMLAVATVLVAVGTTIVALIFH